MDLLGTLFQEPGPIPPSLREKPQDKKNLSRFRRYCVKAGRVLSAESYLEHRHLIWAEVQSSTAAICTHPAPEINERIQGKHTKYVFDVWIRALDGTELYIEVKPTEELVTDEEGGERIPSKWKRIQAWCLQHGINSKFVTEEALEPHSQEIDNWIILLPFVQRGFLTKDVELVQKLLNWITAHQGAFTLTEAESQFPNRQSDAVLAGLALMLYRGLLQSPSLKKPISRSITFTPKPWLTEIS